MTACRLSTVPLTPGKVEPTRLQLTLPVPPSINHQYTTVNDRRVLAAEGRSFKAEVAHQVMVTLSRSPHKAHVLHQLRISPLVLTVRFFFASALRRDVDSGLKITQDALCLGLGLNDNRIVELHLYKEQDKVRPRTEISLSWGDADRPAPTPSHP